MSDTASTDRPDADAGTTARSGAHGTGTAACDTGRVTACTRGQTTVDFVVALGVFLLVVTATVGFVPQLFASFDDAPERPLVADRAADRLVDALADATTGPTVLNETCTLTLLQQSGTACGFDTSTDLSDQIGVGGQYRVNVSLGRNRTADPGIETLCTDGTDIQSCASGGTRLAAGPAVPADRSSVDSTRWVVTVESTHAVLVVQVW